MNEPGTPVVQLRTFRFPDDYESVRKLWAGAGPGIHLRRSDEPAEIAKKVQHDPGLFLIAEADGQIVGAVIGGFDGRRGMVYHLAVAGHFRRFGIGTALMEEIESRLRSKGCLKSYLLVVKDNEPGRHFYEDRGWEQMDILIYGKDLA
jgi:ribosomal protein S18 acetylase RimI-like enzyme